MLEFNLHKSDPPGLWGDVVAHLGRVFQSISGLHQEVQGRNLKNHRLVAQLLDPPPGPFYPSPQASSSCIDCRRWGAVSDEVKACLKAPGNTAAGKTLGADTPDQRLENLGARPEFVICVVVSMIALSGCSRRLGVLAPSLINLLSRRNGIVSVFIRVNGLSRMLCRSGQ
jgi:hypothetical protein